MHNNTNAYGTTYTTLTTHYHIAQHTTLDNSTQERTLRHVQKTRPTHPTHKQSNKSHELNDGVAIATKNNIQHKIINNFHSDPLAVEINTPFTTLYLPPRSFF